MSEEFSKSVNFLFFLRTFLTLTLLNSHSLNRLYLSMQVLSLRSQSLNYLIQFFDFNDLMRIFLIFLRLPNFQLRHQFSILHLLRLKLLPNLQFFLIQYNQLLLQVCHELHFFSLSLFALQIQLDLQNLILLQKSLIFFF